MAHLTPQLGQPCCSFLLSDGTDGVRGICTAALSHENEEGSSAVVHRKRGCTNSPLGGNGKSLLTAATLVSLRTTCSRGRRYAEPQITVVIFHDGSALEARFSISLPSTPHHCQAFPSWLMGSLVPLAATRSAPDSTVPVLPLPSEGRGSDTTCWYPVLPSHFCYQNRWSLVLSETLLVNLIGLLGVQKRTDWGMFHAFWTAGKSSTDLSSEWKITSESLKKILPSSSLTWLSSDLSGLGPIAL